MKTYPKTKKGDSEPKYSYVRYSWWDRLKLRWRMRKSWSKLGENYECNCTPHDITIPSAAHAVDCPRYE